MSKQGFVFFIILSYIKCDQINQTIEKGVVSQINIFDGVGKIEQVSSVYTLAQTTAWLNSTYFIVGSWSGILSLYSYQSETKQLQLKQIVKSDEGDGIEMVSNLLPDNRFVSSNTNESLFVYFYDPITNILSNQILYYNSSIGFANSVVYSKNILVTGHENGFIIIWNDTGSIFQQVKLVNISSSNPIHSPYPLKNIRALSVWQDHLIISGSEDGDICIIEIPSGNVITRKRYNNIAQRGINDLQVYENYLILSNCAVGQNDKNTWLYKLNNKNLSIDLIDAVNLQDDPSLSQVFNFNVVLGLFQNDLYWFASTQEGLLWFGLVINEKLIVQGNITLGIEQGFALDYTSNTLVAASNNIFVYQIIN